MFSDRDAWFSHELKHHYSLYMCKLCGCHCTTAKLLKQHILDEHGLDPGMDLQFLIEHGRIVPSQLRSQDCPFCNDWTTILSRRRQQEDVRQSTSNHQSEVLVSLTQFKRHVATHQEQLAIFAVPKVFDGNEDTSHEAVEMSSLASTSDDGQSQTPHEETVPTESSPSHELFSTRVNVTNLPRGINIADIEAHFRSTGSGGITEIKLMDGLGFIGFKDPLDAQRSVTAFDGSNFMGECIGVRLSPSSLGRDPGTLDVADDPHSHNWQTAATINDINSANPRSNSSRRINSKGQVVAVINHKQENRQEEPSPSYNAAQTYAKRS